MGGWDLGQAKTNLGGGFLVFWCLDAGDKVLRGIQNVLGGKVLLVLWHQHQGRHRRVGEKVLLVLHDRLFPRDH